MTHVLSLLNCWKFVEDLLPIDAVTSESVDCQVANAKRCKVLEEVRAVARVNLEAIKTSLYNDLSSTDMAPLHRNAQPRVAASPASWTDKKVGCVVLLQESSVNLLNLFCNGGIVGRRITLSLDVNDVLYVVVDAVSYC